MLSFMGVKYEWALYDYHMHEVRALSLSSPFLSLPPQGPEGQPDRFECYPRRKDQKKKQKQTKRKYTLHPKLEVRV